LLVESVESDQEEIERELELVVAGLADD